MHLVRRNNKRLSLTQCRCALLASIMHIIESINIHNLKFYLFWYPLYIYIQSCGISYKLIIFTLSENAESLELIPITGM